MDLRRIHPKLAMASLVRKITMLQEQTLARAGVPLTAQQFAALAIVHVRGPQGVQQLAEQLAVDQSVATRLVDRLESKGWVKRSRSPLDGRRIEIAATTAGIELARAGMSRVTSLKRRILRGVPPTDVEALWRTLVRMQDNVARMLEASAR